MAAINILSDSYGDDFLYVACSVGFWFSGPLVRVHSLLASPQEVRSARSVVCINQEREREGEEVGWVWGQYLMRLYNMIKKTGASVLI
jgi:hypothetical protein